MIHILGSEFVHFFLIEQDGEITLVDAGLSGYRDTLEPALASAGRSIDDVKAIVLTHADPDHVGFAGELQQTHGIPVYVHWSDGERTRQGKTKQTEGSPLATLPMLRHSHGRRALRHMIANGGAKQLKVAEVIGFDDGDELDVPGRLRVIHTPGHTDRRSAFAGTSLHDRLQDLGVTQVVLTGISTTAGVESTARAAYDLGYHVVLATDAMTDRDADAHQNSITRIFPKLGETATTDEILAKLAQTQS